MFQLVNKFTDETFFICLVICIGIFHSGISLIVLDVFLYIPRLVLVFQDVPVIYELYDLPHSQIFA